MAVLRTGLRCSGLLLWAVCCSVTHAAGPYDLTVQLDLRLTAAQSPLSSFSQGGLGLLRYDESHQGLHAGPLMLDYSGPVTDTIRAAAVAFANFDGDKNPIDLTEAYLEWRPVPTSPLRWRTQVGAFYPPISMENRAAGWQSLYSIISSAINTWIGEEVRAVGAQTSATLVGAAIHRPFDIGVVAGVYGWNDPMGVVIQRRGWAIHDRQTALWGRLPDIKGMPHADGSFELFHEIDTRPGFHAGLEASYRNQLVVRAMRYDNRGDPALCNTQECAWLSRFNAYGARLELPQGWTVISQWLDGDTSVGKSLDGRGSHILGYWSDFVLVSKTAGPHRITARYERFHTKTLLGANKFNSNQDGAAFMLSYRYQLNDQWQLTAEGLKVDSSISQRALVAAPLDARESSLQLLARYSFSL